MSVLRKLAGSVLSKTAEEHKLQGETEVQGIPVAIENRRGSVREGTTEDGHHWRTKMKAPYGYIKGTEGADGEEVDAYVGPDKDAPKAYVVHQHKPDGTGFDEDKVMLGFKSKEEAKKTYLEHYDDPKFLGPISVVPVEKLKAKIEEGKPLKKIAWSLFKKKETGPDRETALRSFAEGFKELKGGPVAEIQQRAVVKDAVGMGGIETHLIGKTSNDKGEYHYSLHAPGYYGTSSPNSIIHEHAPRGFGLTLKPHNDKGFPPSTKKDDYTGDYPKVDWTYPHKDIAGTGLVGRYFKIAEERAKELGYPRLYVDATNSGVSYWARKEHGLKIAKEMHEPLQTAYQRYRKDPLMSVVNGAVHSPYFEQIAQHTPVDGSKLPEKIDLDNPHTIPRGFLEYLGGKLHGKTTHIPFYKELEPEKTASVMRKIAAQVLPKGGEYAPGIPSAREIHPLPRVFHDRPETWQMAVQHHDAEKAGPHIDLRLVDNRGLGHSWAIPKASLPKPGEKVLAVQQPTHTQEYAARKGTFELPEGYGKGTVRSSGLTPVEVVRSQPGVLRFNVYGGSKEGNQEFALIKTDKGHLLHNISTTAATGVRGAGGHPIPQSKPKYKEINTDRVRFDDAEEIHQAKVDGAHVTFHLRGDKGVKVFSYRPTERATGVLEHTHKLPDYRNLTAPPGLSGTVLRGELYAADTRTGKALPAEQVGGLLNSTVWRSREKQKELGAELRPVIFDVVKYQGRDMENAPYSEKLQVLREVQQKIPRLKLPPTATTPEEKEDLFHRIRTGKEPITNEGIVAWKLPYPYPTKAKFKPDVDAEIVGVTPGKGKHEGRIGALQVRLPGKDAITHVGTGLSDELRDQIAKKPEDYIGRVAKVRTMQVFPSGRLRAPAFAGFHLEKGKQPMEGEKLAAEVLGEEPEKKPGIVAPVLMTGGGLSLASKGKRGLLGLKRIYHGTHSGDVARSIKEHGLDPAFGGLGAARVSPEYTSASKGFVHATGIKPLARMYAAMDEPLLDEIKGMRDMGSANVRPIAKKIFKRAITGKGHVISADIPMSQWERFIVDPDQAGPHGPKNVAAKSVEAVKSKYIHGGKDRLSSLPGRVVEMAKALPGYVKKYPGRFAGGALLTGGGLYMAGKGIQGLRRRFGETDGE